MTENEIFAMSLLLKTNICVYSESNQWYTFLKTGSLRNGLLSNKKKSKIWVIVPLNCIRGGSGSSCSMSLCLVYHDF